MRNVGGRPVVTTTTAADWRAATRLVASAQHAAGVVAVDVDTKVHILDTRATDSKRTDQWALDRLKAEQAWSTSKGAGVTVAVVDTGVARVPDLAGQLLPGTDFVDAHGDGTADGHGHGTHVAGVIAALADNGVAGSGFAPQAKVLPVRVLDDSGSGYDSSVTAGLIYAVDHGATVVNMSLGTPGADSAMAAAVSYAQGHDVVVVAAAGNTRATGNSASYPAAFPGVLAVGASDAADNIAAFSTTGSYVSIAAPGVQVLSTWKDGSTLNLSGTSMAAPYAAATAALVRSAGPALLANGVLQSLTGTATDIAPAGRDDASGAGVVDPAAALRKATGQPAASEPGTAKEPVPVPAPVPVPVPVPGPAPTPASAVTRWIPGSTSADVTYGTSVTVRAQLVAGAAGTPITGQAVSWCSRRPTGGSEVCRTATTDPTGTATLSLTPTASTVLVARFGGSSSRAAADSAALRYTVHTKVTVTSTPGALTVTASPGGGLAVSVDTWTGQVWRPLVTRVADARGVLTVVRLVPGSTVRVRTPEHAGLAATVTAGLRIR